MTNFQRNCKLHLCADGKLKAFEMKVCQVAFDFFFNFKNQILVCMMVSIKVFISYYQNFAIK